MKKFFNIVFKVQRKITATLLLGMIIVVTIQVFGRTFFKISTPWTEELSKYLLIWIAFIGGMGALIKGEHLMVDILYNILSHRLKKYARLINDIIYIFFSGFLFFYGIELCTNPMISKSITPAMAMPRVWLYICLPVCMAFMLVYSGYDLIIAIKALFTKDDRTPKDGTGKSKMEQIEADVNSDNINNIKAQKGSNS